VVGGVREAGKIMAAMKTLLEADRCLPKRHALFRDSIETLGGCERGCTKRMHGGGWQLVVFLVQRDCHISARCKCTRFDYWRRHLLFIAEIVMVLYSGHPVWGQ